MVEYTVSGGLLQYRDAHGLQIQKLPWAESGFYPGLVGRSDQQLDLHLAQPAHAPRTPGRTCITQRFFINFGLQLISISPQASTFRSHLPQSFLSFRHGFSKNMSILFLDCNNMIHRLILSRAPFSVVNDTLIKPPISFQAQVL
jgi:hypothetical protein